MTINVSQTTRARGVALAVASTALLATNHVTAKVALQSLNLETFFLLWFAAASALAVGHQVANKRLLFFTQLIQRWRRWQRSALSRTCFSSVCTRTGRTGSHPHK